MRAQNYIWLELVEEEWDILYTREVGGSELKVAPHLISAFRINRAIIHVRPLLFVEKAYALYSVYCVRTSCRNVEVKQACSPPTAALRVCVLLMLPTCDS